ncbi:MAG: formate--phosphoribosylaminoimidazolecarboxamide ligase [Candidatus Diapherotrites archaeon]|nr:formate--phosphoribosylaminoimidazolecarboxamide ligase [Candidatus Diapherotrites archaeon]
MVSKKDIEDALIGYRGNTTIATICSHSALQIFHGARLEGMKTIGITTEKAKPVYDGFPLAKPDEYVVVDSYPDILRKDIQDKLIERNAVLVPHGSFVEYVGAENIEKELRVPMLGNRRVLKWESDREKEREWLKKAGCTVPERFKKPSEIDRPCLVKFYGAKGGRGFFIVINEDEFYKKIGDEKKYIIQEFIIGTRYYFHFFYTPLFKEGYRVGDGRLEMLGIDRRVESNIDELYRFGFTRKELDAAGIRRSFVVTGNLPLAIRESLLPKVFEMGKRVVEVSQELFKPGIIGPFCLETIVTPELDIYVFEISARIVAGTNLYPMGSPYSPYIFHDSMSTGRRIAREIKTATRTNQLDKIVY